MRKYRRGRLGISFQIHDKMAFDEGDAYEENGLGLWCWYSGGGRGEAGCYCLLAAIPDKGAQPQAVTFFSSPKTQPKMHSSLQPTSQQPLPGTRLCSLIKSESGRDRQQQQQSPGGNRTLSSPDPPALASSVVSFQLHVTTSVPPQTSSHHQRQLPKLSYGPCNPSPTYRAFFTLFACGKRRTGCYGIPLPLTKEFRLCMMDVGPEFSVALLPTDTKQPPKVKTWVAEPQSVTVPSQCTPSRASGDMNRSSLRMTACPTACWASSVALWHLHTGFSQQRCPRA